MGFWPFLVLMVAAVAVVFRFGAGEERLVLSVLVANFVGTGIFYRLISPDWLHPQYFILCLDIVAWIIIIGVMLRSKRYWPIIIAGFQMVPVFSFFATRIGQEITSDAAGIMQGMWGYLQLSVLLLAALRTYQRERLLLDRIAASPPTSKYLH